MIKRNLFISCLAILLEGILSSFNSYDAPAYYPQYGMPHDGGCPCQNVQYQQPEYDSHQGNRYDQNNRQDDDYNLDDRYFQPARNNNGNNQNNGYNSDANWDAPPMDLLNPQHDAAFRKWRNNYVRSHTGTEDARDRDIDRRAYRKGDWGYKQNWRYDRKAFYSGETQGEAYDQEHPDGVGGIGMDPDYDYLQMRRFYLEENARNNQEAYQRQHPPMPSRANVRRARMNQGS